MSSSERGSSGAVDFIATRQHGAMKYKRTIQRTARFGLVAALGLGVAGCDDLLTESPPHIIVADNLYVDAAGFEAGLNGLYAQVREAREGATSNGSNGLRTEMWSVGVDNAFAMYRDVRAFNDWGIYNNSQESFYLDNWTWLYETINAANTIITRAENPDIEWTEAQKNEVLAQARLFRAWAYRHLTYLWGPVPLNLEESSGESIRTDWTRAPVAEVRAQIEEDLLFAEQHLPEMPRADGRLSRAVARHYLADLYLAMDRLADAEAKAAAVVNSGNYSLITERYGVRANEAGVPFMDQFQDGNALRSQGNTEVLWAFDYQENTPGGGQNIMRRYWVNRYYNLRGIAVSAENGGRGIGRLATTRWSLTDNYEPQDDRGSIHAIRWFYLYNDPDRVPEGKELGDTLWLVADEDRVSNPAWPSTRKWDWASPIDVDEARSWGDQPYIRLAETILLLAEAQFRQGKLEEATENLNTLRRRANASEITAAQVTLDFILDERSRELLTEEERRYTLLRTHTWLDRVRQYNPIAGPKVAPRDTLLPIPQTVIDANIGAPMEQNPGY